MSKEYTYKDFSAPAQSSKGWQGMSALLDKEMPAEKRRKRGFAWWWVPILALCVGASAFMVVFNQKKDINLALTNSSSRSLPANANQAKPAVDTKSGQAVFPVVSTPAVKIATQQDVPSVMPKAKSAQRPTYRTYTPQSLPMQLPPQNAPTPIQVQDEKISTEIPVAANTLEEKRESMTGPELSTFSVIPAFAHYNNPSENPIAMPCPPVKISTIKKLSTFWALDAGSRYSTPYGFNQFYAGISGGFKLSKHWSLGLRFGYDFAQVEAVNQNQIYQIPITGTPGLVDAIAPSNIQNTHTLSTQGIVTEAVVGLNVGKRWMLGSSTGYRYSFNDGQNHSIPYSDYSTFYEENRNISVAAQQPAVPLLRSEYHYFTQGLQINYRLWKGLSLQAGGRYDFSENMRLSDLYGNMGVRWEF